MTPHTPLIEALKERWQNIDRELAPGEPTSAALMRDALIEILRLNEALRIATEKAIRAEALEEALKKAKTILESYGYSHSDKLFGDLLTEDRHG